MFLGWNLRVSYKTPSGSERVEQGKREVGKEGGGKRRMGKKGKGTNNNKKISNIFIYKKTNLFN